MRITSSKLVTLPIFIIGALIAHTSKVSAEVPVTTSSISSGNTGANSLGNVTGLPIPRFVSLKPSDTPMREGPSKDHAIKWIFKRESLPVEVTAEFDNWRRVRDSEGVEGWVYQTRISGRRTVMIMPQTNQKELVQKFQHIILYGSPNNSSATVKLEPGVIAVLDSCNKSWCLIKGEGFSGYLSQDKLWGVYPSEIVK